MGTFGICLLSILHFPSLNHECFTMEGVATYQGYCHKSYTKPLTGIFFFKIIWGCCREGSGKKEGKTRVQLRHSNHCFDWGHGNHVWSNRNVNKNVQNRYRPFKGWRHFTTTTRILQGIAFLCKLRLLLLTLHCAGTTKFKDDRKNEMNYRKIPKISPSMYKLLQI